MAPRQELQLLLESFTEHVYFQPPSNFDLQFPCIVYKRDDDEAKFADNRLYQHTKRYEVTVIDRDPDSLLWDILVDLPLCNFDRHFTADNLNHDVFNLFF